MELGRTAVYDVDEEVLDAQAFQASLGVLADARSEDVLVYRGRDALNDAAQLVVGCDVRKVDVVAKRKELFDCGVALDDALLEQPAQASSVRLVELVGTAWFELHALVAKVIDALGEQLGGAPVILIQAIVAVE